ncbi:hypothetical protein HPB49_013044 [Dermacentor silvarum]|uniref:Uncharacterized protein n=1 Tax=Dermacentor silvarum TaxID=543639 RepID=A0ACB8E184_DERSI|nr:hypothetical protein HPB49_013044 [Dermacentor silvarum]
MAVPDEASHPGVAGASLSSEVQHCYQRPSHVPPPPSALMPFAQEKMCSVAAMNAKENNQRVSSRLAMLWRPLRAADKEHLQRKVAEVVAVQGRKYPDYIHHPHEAHRRKEQKRITKQVTGKLKNDSSCDKEQQPATCMVVARGRGGPKFPQQLHSPPLPPTPRCTHSATITAAQVSASGAGQGTVACMPRATVPATIKDPEEQVVPVKVAALRALAELWKRQPQHFHNYAELTLINICDERVPLTPCVVYSGHNLEQAEFLHLCVDKERLFMFKNAEEWVIAIMSALFVLNIVYGPKYFSTSAVL